MKAIAEILKEHGISCNGKVAIQLTKRDYETYDHIIPMDTMNVRNINRIIGSDSMGKVKKLLDFADGSDIADPWYTGNFDITYDDVLQGCEGLLEYLTEK